MPIGCALFFLRNPADLFAKTCKKIARHEAGQRDAAQTYREMR
jgi:hypothetical protein